MTSIAWLAHDPPPDAAHAAGADVASVGSWDAFAPRWTSGEFDAVVVDPAGLDDGVVARLAQVVAPDAIVVVVDTLDDDAARRAAELGVENLLLRDELDPRHLRRAFRDAGSHGLRERAARLEHLAHIDPLTELLNRRGLARALAEEAARARRDGSHVGAILIDGDDFKRVNDTFGHDGGDAVLQEIAERLRSTLRPSDRVGRLGGDEFLVLLPDTRHAEALEVAERLRVTIAGTPVALPADGVTATVSLAVVPLQGPDDTITDIMRRAHEALVMCKSAGKNTVVGNGTVEQITGARLPPVHELCDAEGFGVSRHPIVRLSDGEVVGHELLTRGPAGALESPRELFRHCQEVRILPDVDVACLRSCLDALSALPSPGRVHVNLFPHTLAALEARVLVDLLAPAASEHDVVIELSEEQFVGDMSMFASKVEALRAVGVDLAIDDVGFGRSSLEALVMLEPRVLKVCPGYVTGCAEDVARQRALERLVKIADASDSRLIAEGVESEADRDCVAALGVEEAQGYLWGAPSPCVTPLPSS